MTTPTLAVLPGDGIGPEVIAEALRVLDWVREQRGFTCDVTEHDYGFSAYRKHGALLRDEVLADAMAADAVLFGAVGGPDYDDVPREVRRAGSILRLRTELKTFANLRPALGLAELADAAPFKKSAIEGVDLVIVREANGGIYFGTPRGVEPLPGGGERAINTEVYTTAEIDRVARAAFELARTRRGRVCSVDKSNVLETGGLWRQVVTRVHEESFRDVELNHLLVDNCALQLVHAPHQFDVIVASNMFGDILSDVAAAIMGSLGMAPSASLAAPDAGGRRRAIYEPVHGSAPDITGQNIANPLGAIRSLALALQYSFGRGDDAELIEQALRRALAGGVRTPDIAGDHRPVGTRAMGDAILAELSRLS